LEKRLRVDELGSVDYLVVEPPAGREHFTDEMADEFSQPPSGWRFRS